MGAKTLNAGKYGALCAVAAPRVVRDEQHLEEVVGRLEELTLSAIPHLKNGN